VVSGLRAHTVNRTGHGSGGPGLHDEYIATTGAILGGRHGWDQAIDGSRPYGGAWQGPIFVLTHHPQDAAPADGVTFLNCGAAEAVRIGLAAAGGKNLEVFSPTIGRQLLELGLIAGWSRRGQRPRVLVHVYRRTWPMRWR
jgi:hypothetical protein